MAFQAVRGYKQQMTVVKIITGFSEQEPWLLNVTASNPNYRQFLPEKGSKKTGYTVFATRWHLVAVTTNWNIVLLPRYAIFYCFICLVLTKVFHATSINKH